MIQKYFYIFLLVILFSSSMFPFLLLLTNPSIFLSKLEKMPAFFSSDLSICQFCIEQSHYKDYSYFFRFLLEHENQWKIKYKIFSLCSIMKTQLFIFKLYPLPLYCNIRWINYHHFYQCQFFVPGNRFKE